MAFLAAAAGRFATGRFWPGTWMISSVGKDQFNNWEFCILKIRPIVCFFLRFWDCRSFYFHSLKVESTFLVSKRLLCLYDKKNNTYLLVDMKFLFSYSTQHLTRSLRSLVSYRVKHSKGNSISTRTHVLFFMCIINNNNSQFSQRNRKQPLFHYMII